MPDPPGTTSVGTQVLADRYELRGLVGRGGMAEVHRAHDRLLDRRVVVKMFRRGDDPARRRFEDEALALARLAHPGLVAIFDLGAVDDRPFLVMEFVEGTNLRTRLQAGPLPLGQVLRIGGVLADALAHAHHRGVVHRDVKPSNIILDREGLPHLTDFGFALLAGAPRLTSTNDILGTPARLAPEQVPDTEVGPPADVYALGLVLLECLSGEPEYALGSSAEVALSRLNRPPRIPTALPSELTELLTAMTAPEPHDRPTAQTCALRLEAALEDTDPDGGQQPASMPPVAGDSAASWAEEDQTAQVPMGPMACAGSGLPWRVLTASVAAVAALVAALVFLPHAPQPLTGRVQSAATGRNGSGTGANTSAGTARSSGTGGSGIREAGPTVGLVAHERPAAAGVPTTAPALASSTPSRSGTVRSTQAMTSAASTPGQGTVATEPPTVASSTPPATTTISAQPPSTSSGPSDVPSP